MPFTSHSTSPSETLAELRAAMAKVGDTLDRPDIADDEFNAADREYGDLFDRLCDAQEALLASPIDSADDLAAKIDVIGTRARLDHVVVEYLQRLAGQVKEWQR